MSMSVEVNFEKLRSIVAKDGQAALVLFTGNWCGDCMAFKPTWDTWNKAKTGPIFKVEIQRGGKEWREWAIDSTLLEASRKDLEAAWGWDDINKRFVWGYKVHAIVDAESELPLQMIVSPANLNDCSLAVPLLTRAATNLRYVPRFVIADKGYDSRKIREHIDFWMDSEAIIKCIERTDIKPVYDMRFRRLYRRRASVERFFSKLESMNLLRRLRVFGTRTIEKLFRLIGIGFLVLALLAVHTHKRGLLRSPKGLMRSLS